MRRAPDFVDFTGLEGAAQLGYGDGDEATVVSYGQNSNQKHITTYFRHSFEIPVGQNITRAQLGLLRDDGAVVNLVGIR